MKFPGEIRNWTYSPGNHQNSYSDNKSEEYRGLELFFNEQDAGSFGNYRCYVSIRGEKKHGAPFSLLVEGKITKIRLGL